MITAPRGVASTRRQHEQKLLLIQDGNVILSHNHSDTGPAIPIIASLLLCERVTQSYIAGVNLFESLADLNKQMQHVVPGWRMRMSSRRRHAFTKDGRRTVTGRFFVDYFSVDTKTNENTRLPRCKFDVLNLDLLADKPPTDINQQLEMALAILEMCDKRKVKYRHTRGGLGSVMLKVSPYWEHGRIAAPKFINDKARTVLPGNFYSLSHKMRNKHGISPIKHCYYIDQTSSHHSIASGISLPHPTHLHARGNWKTLTGKWKTELEPTHVGLVLARITIAPIGPTQDHLYPQWALKSGTRYVWIWTPELRLLQDHRLQLEYYVASFTSTTYDPALREYAEWSLGELSSDILRAQYKKGSLLAAYGMLAFNSAGREIYRYWGGNSSKPICEIPRAGFVAESRIEIPAECQLSTVNVVARGVIEAETRTRSIEYARELHMQGFHIPQIYADGLLVETEQMPFVRDGWRVSHSLTNVYLPRPNAIVSDQIVKLPGVGGDREWERQRDEALKIVPVTSRIPELVA